MNKKQAKAMVYEFIVNAKKNQGRKTDRKGKAMREIEKAKASGIKMPNALSVVERYPDFEHIQIRLIEPGIFEFVYNVNLVSVQTKEDAMQLAGNVADVAVSLNVGAILMEM